MRRQILLRLVVASFWVVIMAGCSSGDDGETVSTTTSTTSLVPTPAGELLEGDLVDQSDLGLGECFNQRLAPGQGAGEIPSLYVTLCSEAHLNEIYYTTVHDDPIGTGYPGSELVREFADAECFKEFKDFIGVQYEISIYELGYLFPSHESWLSGDRDILCFVFDRDGSSRVGTVEGDTTCTDELPGVTDDICEGYASTTTTSTAES